MRKQFLKCVIFTSLVVVLVNCKKFGKEYDTYFYTDIENTSGPLTLYVDGENKGALPNLKTSVSPGNDTVINNALHLNLRSGRYKIEGKDDQGNVKCSGTLKFRTNSLNCSSTMGGQATASSGKIIVTKLNY
jgi:hypothetical protein